jgi:glucosamine--fructose-6-phosphate aminotransferase (isomerizing)
MCGIVGYIGDQNIKKILLDGLKELEYRGYDSAGIALMQKGHITGYKAVGKLENLIHKTEAIESEGFGVGIAHTRWATHGKPTEINAHPHQGRFSYVVHNGIIENYTELKKQLQAEGASFLSQTDTEAIVHLYEHHAKQLDSPERAFEETIKQLEGAYAILLIDERCEDRIFFAKKGSPLQIGLGENGRFFASSDAALVGLCTEAIYLEDGSWGWVDATSRVIYEGDQLTTPAPKPIPPTLHSAQKEGFRFFMEKEIYEQAQVLGDTLMGRLQEDRVHLEEIDAALFEGVEALRLCACGTSYHAALASTYLFERLSRMEARVEIASEFRYRDPVLKKSELFVVISQSGETADTLEALKMAKRAGLKTLAICNVDNSSIVREADATLLTRAGIEKGVASTKAFATQMMVLWLLSLFIARQNRSLDQATLTQEIAAMRRAPQVLHVPEKLHDRIHRLSKRYLHGHGFFFIGRDLFYPLALEGALKLKEISYLHAEGYPAGEMKHGPIALADSELFTIALLPGTLLKEKMRSNVEELIARDSTTLAIGPECFELADDYLPTQPTDHPMLEFYEMMVVMQLLALEISIRLGNDVDMPRNLAKSVTVE